jgi:hypothetical protein
VAMFYPVIVVTLLLSQSTRHRTRLAYIMERRREFYFVELCLFCARKKMFEKSGEAFSVFRYPNYNVPAL